MSENVNERINRRLDIIAVLFMAFFLIIVLRLVNLQIIHGKEYDEESRNKLLRTREIVANRGNILDRNSLPIAVNRMGYAVRIARTSMKEAERNDMILKLVSIFEKNGEAIESDLGKYLTFNPIDFGKTIKNNEQALEKWKKEMVLVEKETALLSTPQDTFNYFRKKKFKIDDKYSDEEAYKIMSIRYEMLIKGYTEVDLLLLAKNVGAATVAQLEERHQEFPGVAIDVIPHREYVEAEPYGHILGYVRIIDEKEYEVLKEKGYKRTDLLGKTGIELNQEEYLRGINGKRWVEVDSSGRVMDEVGIKPAIPGNDVVLTIDSRLQKAAMESLQKNIEEIRSKADNKTNHGDACAGAVVAIDVSNGEVLTLAGYPSYDPSIYLAGPEDVQIQTLLQTMLNDNINKPFFNRAIQEAYAPGSTFKPLTAIAGLQEGAITDKTKIYCTGAYTVHGMRFKCHGGPHGNISLTDALAKSCNYYFNEVAYRIGIDKLDTWAKAFGLGSKTGIEVPFEIEGFRANRDTKKLKFAEKENQAWFPADTVQAGIGQSFNAFTPLQLASYVSTIANGGTRYKPHIVKRVVAADGSTVKETEIEYEKVPVSKETIEAVKKGMVSVANQEDGTAASIFKDFPFVVAGKTGTPETGQEKYGKSSNGLFIAYAPADNPKIAVAVVIERGVWGSLAAPVARDVLKEYFGLNSGVLPKDSVIADEVIFTR